MRETDKMDKMSYNEFIGTVSMNTGVPEPIVRKIFDEGIDVIGATAYDKHRCVEIRNFGVFFTRVAPGRNVCLNNVSNFDSYTKFQFKPSSHFTKKHRTLIGEISN